VSFDNFSVCKNGKWVKLSLILELPALCVHVAHVVNARSFSNMIRVATGTAADAGMKYFKSESYVPSVCDNPRNSVCVICSLSSVFSRKAKLAVAILLNMALPRPAFVWDSYFYMRPKEVFVMLGQELRKVFGWDNLRLHNICCLLCLLCHAPGLRPSVAGAFLF